MSLADILGLADDRTDLMFGRKLGPSSSKPGPGSRAAFGRMNAAQPAPTPALRGPFPDMGRTRDEDEAARRAGAAAATTEEQMALQRAGEREAGATYESGQAATAESGRLMAILQGQPWPGQGSPAPGEGLTEPPAPGLVRGRRSR